VLNKIQITNLHNSYPHSLLLPSFTHLHVFTLIRVPSHFVQIVQRQCITHSLRHFVSTNTLCIDCGQCGHHENRLAAVETQSPVVLPLMASKLSNALHTRCNILSQQTRNALTVMWTPATGSRQHELYSTHRQKLFGPNASHTRYATCPQQILDALTPNNVDIVGRREFFLTKVA
jgi:hypothetical protein